MAFRQKSRLAVVDDHREYGEWFGSIVKQCFTGGSVDLYVDGNTFQESGNTYDIVFLDIELGNEDGIALSKQILNQTEYIVYITGQNQRIMDAFGYRVIGFLTKNMTEPEIRHRLGDLEEEYIRTSICFESDQGTAQIRVSSILYVMIENREMYCCLKNGKRLHVRNGKIGQWQKQLDPDQFHLLDRGTLVNLESVIGIHGVEVRLCDGTVLYASRRQKGRVGRAWLAWLYRRETV
ncbi:MAG: LytR/AlgR family response regulator transcription factor [Bulleidia sp.]